MNKPISIRLAEFNEIDRLSEIEREAGKRFHMLGFPEPQHNFFLSRADFLEGISDARIWVAVECDAKLVGFAFAEYVDHTPHLKEIDVLIEYGRRGIGAQLIDKVCIWARRQEFSALTLTTFRDVEWNGPYYKKMGFVEMNPEMLGDELRQILNTERETAFPGWERVAMVKDLNIN